MKFFSILLLISMHVSNPTAENLVGKWKLNEIEEFEEKWPLEEENKNDKMHLMSDGTYTMVLYGEKKSGTWKFNAGAKIINFVNGDKKFYFKYINLSEGNLVLEWQKPSLIKTKLHYIVQN